MTVNHTPGPWEIARSSQGYPYQIRAPKGHAGPGGIRDVTRWAAIGLPSSAEGEANARLIAAAPELLAALQEAVRLYQSYGLVANCLPTGDWINKTRAVIANATGAA